MRETKGTAAVAVLVIASTASTAEAAVPTVPVVVSPAQGGISYRPRPTLIVTNASDADGHPLRYELEVYSDATLTDRVAQTAAGGVPQGAGGTTSWRVGNATPLMVGNDYCWRARAVDPDGVASAWTAMACFEVRPVPVPVIVAPMNGAILGTLTVTIVIENPPGNEAVFYDWDVARDAAFTNIVQSGINDGVRSDTTTAIQIAHLEEDRRSCFRARADAGENGSAYCVPTCFTVDTGNDAPEVPEPRAPSWESPPDTARPTFDWSVSTDPEGDAVTYDLRVFDAGDQLVAGSNGVDGVSIQIATDLVPGATYSWVARATDVHGLASRFSAETFFKVPAPEPPDDAGTSDASDDPAADSAAAGCCETGSAEPRGLALLIAGVVIGLVHRRRSAADRDGGARDALRARRLRARQR